MKKQIDKYTSLLYVPEDRIACCLIRGRAVQHRFLMVKNIGKFIPFLQAMNCQGWNVYVTPSVLKAGAVGRTKAHFMPMQDVIFIDADNKQAMEKVRSGYPYPTLVVKTSIGHYHIYWKLNEKIFVKEQEDVMKLLAKDVGADLAATDVSRVLRLPGFWHKGKNNTVDIVFSREGKVNYKFFRALFSSQASITPPTNCTRSVVFSGVCKKGVYISDIVGRNGEKLIFNSKSEEDWYLVNEWLRHGMSQEECVKRLKLRRAGEKRNVDYYANKTVGNA
ncbi:MAG TPA: hypothetical protein EYP28_02060, partial [Methanophagales archaeon]|nr:hypothetical protein [Methanophagales archaeon]